MSIINSQQQSIVNDLITFLQEEACYCAFSFFLINLGKQAEAIGKRGQQLMESLSMDQVYDYMFHLISEYSKLQDFKPVPPSSAQEVCEESLLCLAEPKQKEYLKRAAAVGSPTPPCSLAKPPNSNFFNILTEHKKKLIQHVKDMEMRNALRHMIQTRICMQLPRILKFCSFRVTCRSLLFL